MSAVNVANFIYGNECIKMVRRQDTIAAIITENSDQQFIFGTMDYEPKVLEPTKLQTLDVVDLTKFMPKNYHFYGLDLSNFEPVISKLTNSLHYNFGANIIDARNIPRNEKMTVYPTLGAFSDKENPTFVIDSVNHLKDNLQAFNNNNCYLILVNCYEDPTIPAKFIDSTVLSNQGVNIDLPMVYFDNGKLFKLS